MSDPLDVLHKNKMDKFQRKEDLKSTSGISNESLAKELPVLEYKYFSINTANFTTVFSTLDKVILGNSQGSLNVYNYRESEIMTLQGGKKLKSSVVCIDIWDNTLAAVGHADGQIALYDLKSSKHLKNFQVSSGPVTKLQFSTSSEELICLSGKIQILEVKKKIMSYSMKSSTFEIYDQVIVTFEVLTDPKINKSYLLVLSDSRLLIYSLTDQAVFFEISSIRPDSIPYIAWIKHERKYHLSISYSKTIAIYNVLQDGINASLCFDSSQDVCGMKWLKSDILAVLGQNCDVLIYLFEGRNKQLVQQIRGNLELKDQKFLKDAKGNLCSAFHNSYSTKEKSVVLGKEKLCVLTLYTWSSCLDALVASEKWVEALALGFVFLQEGSFSFMEISAGKIEIKLKMQEILLKYAKEEKISNQTRVLICMEYCVKYQMVDLLFGGIFENLGGKGIEYFSNEIYPYVINGVVRSIPPVCFSKIIEYFISKNQFEILENIILHIDPPALDAKMLLPFCDKYNLVNAYIYISTQSSLQSFVNPLKKMFKLMAKAVEQPRKQYFLYNLLWYLRMCFNGSSFFQEGKMENREGQFLKICEWLLKRKHLENVLEIDPDITFQVIGIIFQDSSLFDFLTSKKNAVLYKGILDKFSQMLKSQESYSQKLFLFVVSLMKAGKITFDRKEKLDISKFLMKFKNSEDSLFILSLIQSSEPLDDQESLDLLRLATYTKHLDILSYLYQATKRYQEAINCLLESESKDQQKKVYKLLNDIYQELAEDEIPEFKELVLKNLKELSTIDTELLGKFMNNCFKNDHFIIIEKLSAAPMLQMKYLTDLVISNNKLDEKLILLNVKLLCQYRPESLMEFLVNAEDYSFHECLNIVKSFNHTEGTSYMFEKLGLIREAIVVLTSKKEDLKYEIIKKIKSKQPVSKDLISRIVYLILLGKDICKRNSPAFQDNEYNENWYMFINKVFEVYTELVNIIDKASGFIDMIENSIQKALEDMISQVEFDVLVTHITKRFGDLPFKHFKECTYKALNRLAYAEGIINKANSLVLNDRSMITDKLINYYSQGICSDEFLCKKCHEEIDFTMVSYNQDSVIIYQDGTVYHSSCMKNTGQKGKN